MRSVRFRPEIEEDMNVAFDFYEKECPGLGGEFIYQLRMDFRRLEDVAGLQSKRFGLFRLRMDRFPFGIYYFIKEETIVIVAVLDLRSNPVWIGRAVHRRNRS